jgi:hypothetical protein
MTKTQDRRHQEEIIVVNENYSAICDVFAFCVWFPIAHHITPANDRKRKFSSFSLFILVIKLKHNVSKHIKHL